MGTPSILKSTRLVLKYLAAANRLIRASDSIARVEASRLRSRLEHYYETEGRNDPLVILLPKGRYVPQFEPRQLPIDGPAATGSAVRRTHRPLAWLALCFLLGCATATSVLWLHVGPVREPIV